MPLTQQQIQAFFTGADQMAIPAQTVASLQAEGINHPDDLTEFDNDSIKNMA